MLNYFSLAGLNESDDILLYLMSFADDNSCDELKSPAKSLICHILNSHSGNHFRTADIATVQINPKEKFALINGTEYIPVAGKHITAMKSVLKTRFEKLKISEDNITFVVFNHLGRADLIRNNTKSDFANNKTPTINEITLTGEELLKIFKNCNSKNLIFQDYIKALDSIINDTSPFGFKFFNNLILDSKINTEKYHSLYEYDFYESGYVENTAASSWALNWYEFDKNSLHKMGLKDIVGVFNLRLTPENISILSYTYYTINKKLATEVSKQIKNFILSNFPEIPKDLQCAVTQESVLEKIKLFESAMEKLEKEFIFS